MLFYDRQDAGQKLAEKLIEYKNNPKVIIVGLPRGGVIIGHEISQVLKTPLDIVVPRKIGAPDNPELAIGAITEKGQGIFNEHIIQAYNISLDYIDQETVKEQQEARRRLKIYRGNKKPLDLENKIVIIVDDGIATGSTMQAAIASIKNKRPRKIIVAVPVLAQDSIPKIEEIVDELIYLKSPPLFMAVGNFYDLFAQVEDQEVINIIKKHSS